MFGDADSISSPCPYCTEPMFLTVDICRFCGEWCLDDSTELIAPDSEFIRNVLRLGGNEIRVLEGMNSDEEVRKYLDRVATIPVLLPEKEEPLITHLVEGGPDSINAERKLTNACLRAVCVIAKRYVGRGLTFLELVKHGNIGLARSIEKFDPARGYRFSTYASWVIRQSMTYAIAEFSRGNESQLPGDFPDSDNVDDTRANSVTQELLRQDIVGVMADLSPRERDVLRLRFGLEDGRQRTLEEVGLLFGVTRERIRQIEAKALRKLRHPRSPGSSGLVPTTPGADFRTIPRRQRARILAKFADKEREILRLKWGFTDGRFYTAEDIAKKLEISVDAVKDLEERALRMLS